MIKGVTPEDCIADLFEIIQRYSIAAPLKNLIEFQKFYLDEWPTLVWPCGFDLSPETLYERATGNKVKWIEGKQINCDLWAKSPSTRASN